MDRKLIALVGSILSFLINKSDRLLGDCGDDDRLFQQPAWRTPWDRLPQ